MALRAPALSAAAIHRQVAVVARAQGWLTPSYSTVYAIARGLHPGLVTLAHDGPKAYRERFDLVHRREGFAAPSALQTALALRDAIAPKGDLHWHVCGIPLTFYTDHGSDFTSRHLEQVATDLTMVLVFSTAGQPRGRRRIERFFATGNQLFLCTLPGYAPEGAPRPTPTLRLSEIEAGLHRFLVEDYHLRIHGEMGMAPQARWEAGGFLPRLPELAEQLNLLLLTVAKPRRVHRDGIRFQGLRYVDLTLAAYVGEPVTIRYDPRDLAEIRVYHQERFLCRAICPELAGATIGLKDLVRARDARRRELHAGILGRAKLVDLLLRTVVTETPTDASPARPTSRRRPRRG